MPPITQKLGGAPVVGPLPKLVPLPTSGDDTDAVPGLFGRVRAALKTKTRMSLDPKVIRPMPNQPRGKFDQRSQDNLGDSVRAVGQIEDIIVRRVLADGKARQYELVNGEGRWQTALSTGEKLDAIVIESDDTTAVYLIAGIVNMNRREYSFMAKSDFIHYAHTDPQSGLTHKQIGVILGMHKGTVEKFHALQRLSPEVRSLLGLKAPGHAALTFDVLVVLARLSGRSESETEELQLKWARVALKEGIKSASELSDRMRAMGDKKPVDYSPASLQSGMPSEWQLALRFAKGASVQLRRLDDLLKGKTLSRTPGLVGPVHDVATQLRRI